MATYKRYYKEIKYYLGKPVVPTIIRKGELIEEGDFDSLEECENDNYTLVEIKGEYICDYNIDTDNYCRYKKMQKYYNGEPSDPAQYVKGYILYCGCSKEECNGTPRYRDNYDTMCSGYFSKYRILRKQKSLDCGQTWENTDEYTIENVYDFDLECGNGNNNCGNVVEDIYSLPLTDFVDFSYRNIQYHRIWTQNDKHYLFIAGNNQSTTVRTMIVIYELTFDNKRNITITKLHRLITNRMYFNNLDELNNVSIPYIDNEYFYFVNPLATSGNSIQIYKVKLSDSTMTYKEKVLEDDEKYPFFWYFVNGELYGIGRGQETNSFKYIKLDNSFNVIINQDLSFYGSSIVLNEKTNQLEINKTEGERNQNKTFDKIIKVNPTTLTIIGEENILYNEENYNMLMNNDNGYGSYYNDYNVKNWATDNQTQLIFLKNGDCLRVYQDDNRGITQYFINNMRVNSLYDFSSPNQMQIYYEHYT